ncbi:MAG: roadblock/LC7 domain-containing protein [Chloroflexia bacterium]|nr:roadblock/LC7 domain-containing protein [Chloroflexia bacterium]
MTSEIRDLLGSFRSMDGILLAAVVATDGLLIEGVADKDVEVDAVCAVASNGLVMAEALGREIGRGGGIQTILEYKSGLVVLEPLSEDAMVLIVSSRRNNLGRIRFLLKRYHQPLFDAVNAI